LKLKATELEKEEYQKIVKEVMPKTNMAKNCLNAFWVGGTICALAQIIVNALNSFGLSEDAVAFYASLILVTASVILTSLGVYDKIGKFAGAGSGVPITGFANSIASAAIEFKKEGFILGMGSKIFTSAGPVILYGLISSVFVGFIYYIFG
jgi:stage V sporulation protein AC